MPGRVIILGGGVAGMSAAHEVAERGFEVVVLERAYMAGGKARSIPVRTTTGEFTGHETVTGAAAPIDHRVPGEHGFRFFPGFYKHVVDTMRRIPVGSGSAADHLVPTTHVHFTQYDKPSFLLPAAFPTSPRDAAVVLRAILLSFGPVTDLTPEDLAFFGARVWQILTSCTERRLEEYEKTSWWDFVGAESRSPAYQKFLAAGITRSLVAAKAKQANTRTIGDVFVQLMLTILDPLAGPADRVLDGPTNLVWVEPWRKYLEKRGVTYLTDAEVQGIKCDGKRITGVDVIHRGQPKFIQGDYYIAALPIERIVPMLTDRILQGDPSLARLGELKDAVEWMNGIMFYLRRQVPQAHGHAIHIDTEWALTSISQLRFWRNVPADEFGDSDVKTIISVDASDWTAPGPDGKTAQQYTRDGAIREVWRQLKQSCNVEQELLRDEDIEAWFLDPDIVPDPARAGYLANTEPLLVNLKDSWKLRPDATTAIPNLFLASDYVRTHTDLATMEGANEAARRAVNGLLDSIEFAGPRCTLWPLHEPEILAPWRLHDKARFAAGDPWDASLMQVAAHALRGASPILDQARPILEMVSPFVTPVADALELVQGVLESVGLAPALDAIQTHARPQLSAPLTSAVQAHEASAGATGPGMPGAIDAYDDGPSGFQERLGWYRDRLAPTMSAGIPGWEPQRHLYGLVKDFMDRAGKGLRPALTIATARALGGREEDAYPAAAGIEMLHNAFLVHDDIEDGSDYRRGVPTMHRTAGIPIAVNTGDAMNALAARFLRQSGDKLGPAAAIRILDEVDHMLVESLEGQAMELGWVKDNDTAVRADDYLRMVLKKTAWYSFIHPMRIGALVANGDDRSLERFDRLGYLLGLAFQIRDDVLNLDRSATHYGKEVDGDLWEGKRTLPLIYALDNASPMERIWMDSFLARPRDRRLPREVIRLHEMISSGAGVTWAQATATALAEKAAEEFETAYAGARPGPDLSWLRGLIDFLVKRQA